MVPNAAAADDDVLICCLLNTLCNENDLPELELLGDFMFSPLALADKLGDGEALLLLSNRLAVVEDFLLLFPPPFNIRRIFLLLLFFFFGITESILSFDALEEMVSAAISSDNDG